MYDFFWFVGIRVGAANFFLGLSIGIDENNTFQLRLCGLWALDEAWHSAETNLRCAGISGICMPNPSIVVCIIVSEISAFIRTDGHG